MTTLTYTSSALKCVWNSMKHAPLCNELYRTIRQLGICQIMPTIRGCRAGTKLRRPIVVRITSGTRAAMCKQHQAQSTTKCQNQLSGTGLHVNHVNRSNLINIKCNPMTTASVQTSANKYLQVCCLNPRSIKNKTLSISDYIISHDYDIVALTETWLGTSVDKKCIGEVVPSGYEIKHIPHPGRRQGGGVALLYKSAITVKVHGSSISGDYTLWAYGLWSWYKWHHCATSSSIPTSTHQGKWSKKQCLFLAMVYISLKICHT